MAERGPLWDGRHLHHAEWNADAAAEHQRDDDPLPIDNAVVKQSAGYGQHHADFTSPNPVAGGGGRTHPLQRQDKQGAGDEVDDFDQVLASGEFVHFCANLVYRNFDRAKGATAWSDGCS